MASRDIKDCILPLRKSWEYALQRWKEKHPNGPYVVLTCTYRSIEEQDELYAIGRTKPGKKVTKAKGGQSKHNTDPSHAFDIAFVNKDRTLNWNTLLFLEFAAIIREYNSEIIHGGIWKIRDYPHFEI